MKPIKHFDAVKSDVVIESVVPLNDSQKNNVLKSLKLDPSKYQINNRHNPLLIAGIRVIYSGKIIDLSFINLLNQLSS